MIGMGTGIQIEFQVKVSALWAGIAGEMDVEKKGDGMVYENR